MRRKFFVLDGDNKPVPVASEETWRDWYDEHRIVAQNELDGIKVSTSFVGVGGIFFESVVFREWDTPLGLGFRPIVTIHTRAWDEAMKAHRKLLEETHRGVYDDER